MLEVDCTTTWVSLTFLNRILKKGLKMGLLTLSVFFTVITNFNKMHVSKLKKNLVPRYISGAQ